MGNTGKGDKGMSSEEQSTEDTIRPGHILGERYEIKDLLGSGGMAKVYSAHDDKLRINIALKVLDKKHYSDEEFVKRFYREAHSAAKLNHRSIARVYDVGELEGKHFIAMELAEGQTLEEKIKEHCQKNEFFPIEQACLITKEILDALNYAHSQGIIHRDIKPGNIMITDKREVKITDFGIAKQVKKSGKPEHTVLTKEFTLIGTPQYMSPEQIRQEKVNEKTDVFSAGVVLYEMLTARLPFENVKETESTTAITNTLTKKLQSPKMINKKIPGKLEDILLKALEKNPEKRYDAEGFHKDLDAYIKGETVSVEGSFKRRFELNRRQFLVKGGLGLLGAGLLIGTPTILIIKKNEYEKSLYSTLDRIQEAQTWEEMKPHLKELEMKLFDWVLERAKYLRKDMAPFYFNENKTVKYINDSYHGFHFIRDIYSLGFKETRNPEFLELFSHFYDLVKFDETKTYQYYLNRFRIDCEMLKLLTDINFKKREEFRSKMKAAIEHLITDRYNKKGSFFQYIAKNDEELDEQVLYACTQFYLLPILTEGFKVFDIKKDFGIKSSEYLNLIINQTKTSNKILLGPDYGVYFGAFIYVISEKPSKYFFKSGHSDKTYLSEDIVKYIEHGLYPLLQLYQEIERAVKGEELETNITFKRNIQEFKIQELKEIEEEKKELTNTFLRILGFYRSHLHSDRSSPYYIPIRSEKLEIINPPSLLSNTSYFNFLNSLINKEKNGETLFSEHLDQEQRKQLCEEKIRISKIICQKNNFNKEYTPFGHQSFFNQIICDISDSTIISNVETEKEFLEAISKVK